MGQRCKGMRGAGRHATLLDTFFCNRRWQRINNHHRLEKRPSFDPPLASLYFWLLVLSCNLYFSLPLTVRVNQDSTSIEKRAIRKTSYLFGHGACCFDYLNPQASSSPAQTQSLIGFKHKRQAFSVWNTTSFHLRSCMTPNSKLQYLLQPVSMYGRDQTSDEIESVPEFATLSGHSTFRKHCQLYGCPTWQFQQTCRAS